MERLRTALLLSMLAVLMTGILQAQRLEPFKGNRGKFGYRFKHSGEVVIEPNFEAAKSFTGEVGRVKINGKWGAVNRSGEVIIEPQFHYIFPFKNGVAKVAQGGDKFGIGSKWGYVNAQGKMVVPAEYDYVGNFMSNGLVKVCEGGYFEEFGEHVPYPELEEMDRLESRATTPKMGEKVQLKNTKMWTNGKWGLYDRQGRLVLPPKYDRIADNTFNGLLKACNGCRIDSENFYQDEWLGGQQGFIDGKGVEVIPLEYSFIMQIEENLCFAATNEKYFDRNSGEWTGAGKVVLMDAQGALSDLFEEIRPFSEERARYTVILDGATDEKAYGFIDKEGYSVIPEMRFEQVWDFQHGYAKVAHDAEGKTLYGLFDKEGNMVMKPEYEQLTLSRGEVCFMKDGEKTCNPTTELVPIAEVVEEEGIDGGWGNEGDDWGSEDDGW